MTKLIHNLDRVALDTTVGLDAPVELSSNVYKKQVSYPGTFGHYSNGETLAEVKITPELQQHWLKSIHRQLADGINIPVQTTHIDSGDPTESGAVGRVIDAVIELDSKGREGLFFICEIPNADDAKLINVSCASLYQPPSFTSGTGVTYARPIRHLAITTKPTVPGLDKWVALSLPDERPNAMTFAELAASIGIEVPEGATDEDIAALISGEVTTLRASVAPIAQSIPTFAKRLVTNNRTATLAKLVSDGKITPAVSSKLNEVFKDGAHVSLSMDSSNQVSDVTDPIFDALTVALSLLPSKSVAGPTGPTKQVPKPGEPATPGTPEALTAEALAARMKKLTPSQGQPI